MRKLVRISLLSTSLAAIGAPAAAGTSVDGLIGGVDQVVIADVVEVPLLQVPGLGAAPAVAVNVGTDEAADVFVLGSRTAVIAVTDEFVARHELKVKTGNKKFLNFEGEDERYKVGGEIKYVDIESLKIGVLELKGVRAMVTSSKSEIGSIPTGNTISMGAIPGLAWAVMPSKGVVRFAAAAGGPALVDAVGGTKIPYRTGESDKIKFGKDKYHKPFRTLIVPMTIGGVALEGAIDPSVPGAAVTSDAKIAFDASIHQGDQYERWAVLSLAGKDQSAWFAVLSTFERGIFEHDAVVGQGALAAFDIAVDPSTSTVALAPATAQTRADAVEAVLGSAEKTAEKAEQKALEEETKARPPAPVEGEEAPKKNVDHWLTLAGAYAEHGRIDKALETWAKALALNDESCDAWLAYGQAQVRAGKAADAIGSFEKASARYHAWWDQDLDIRKREAKVTCLKESKNPFNKIDLIFRKALPEEPKKASSACHVADGWLAAAMLASGDAAAVEKIYRERFDLDPTLAQAWANAALLGGRSQAAQEPLRQALKLERKPTASWRLGLGLVYAEAGDWETASGHFQVALQADPDDPMAVSMWLDGLRAARGGAAALEGAETWLAARPGHAAPLFALAREARIAGDAGRMDAARAAGDAFFADQVAKTPADADLLATWALFLAATDRADDARTAADKALARDPGHATAWLARAAVLEAGGDATGAAEARKNAARLDPLHPGFALLAKATP